MIIIIYTNNFYINKINKMNNYSNLLYGSFVRISGKTEN